MLNIQVIFKTLLITKVCLSLPAYQPGNLAYKASRNNATAFTVDRHHSHPQILYTNNNNVKSRSVKLSQAIPLLYPAGAISNILSRTTLVADKQPSYSNINPDQPVSTTHPKSNLVVANVQPVTAISLTKPRNEVVLMHRSLGNGKLASTVKYTSKIYHINSDKKKASPLVNIRQQENNPEFIIRKQRNFKKNHDDKLIEQKNIKEIKNVNDVNDQQNTTTASSSLSAIKQPSSKASLTSAEVTTMRTSHEIRYLHDIFLNYPKSHHINFGHVELSPNLFEKRFETQKAGNRYKGEVMWLDNTGGFAQHSWNLVQGKL